MLNIRSILCHSKSKSWLFIPTKALVEVLCSSNVFGSSQQWRGSFKKTFSQSEFIILFNSVWAGVLQDRRFKNTLSVFKFIFISPANCIFCINIQKEQVQICCEWQLYKCTLISNLSPLSHMKQQITGIILNSFLHLTSYARQYLLNLHEW